MRHDPAGAAVSGTMIVNDGSGTSNLTGTVQIDSSSTFLPRNDPSGTVLASDTSDRGDDFLAALKSNGADTSSG